MKKRIHIAWTILLSALLMTGCSERKEDKPLTAPVVSVHDAGFADPGSSRFHAVFLKGNNYDLKLCQSCHGADYSGGTTGQTCLTCHNKPNGPENCTTCHGSVNAAPPKDLSGNITPTFRGVGAHQVHLSGGTIGADVACSTCHSVPSVITSAGHIDGTPNAEIRFDTSSSVYRSGVSYSATNVSCTNTYCHGNFKGGNANVTMTWNDTSSAATACGTCHGDVSKSTLKEKAFPVTGHTAAAVTSDCSTCHSRTVNAAMAIIDPSRHMNGQVD